MPHARDAQYTMMQESDLPSFAVLTKKSLVPGGDGTPALQKHLPDLREMLRNGDNKIIIHAATASGKSREIPSVLPHFLKRQLLTATPSRVDVKGMQQAAKVPSCYCMGHGAKYGDKQNASVVFATNGLVQQWYASDGEDYLSNYDGIFFDEIHAMETDPGYALLWEVALATQRKREFLIVGASATFTPELIGRLDGAGVKWISCLDAAAVLAFKAECKWKARKFNLRDLVAMVTGRSAQGFVPTAAPGIRRLHKAQVLFKHLENNLRLFPSRWCEKYQEEALALAFLSAPERLLWCDEVKGHGAAFLGEACAVTGVERSGCVVALLLHKEYHGISCSLALPVTPWVLEQSGLRVPTRTARIISDSTILSFRAECCNRMRKSGYDVKVWYCKAGASEHQIAVSVATTGKSHLCVAVPNGNRLERQSGPDKPKWIKVVCEHICAALADTADHAAVFVGDAALSPGAAHPESYAALVPMLQDGLKAFGIEVIGQIAGVVLAADGKHWSISSRASVEELMDFLCSKSVPTSTLMKQAKPPPLWHWKRNATFDMYYPCCSVCDILAHDGHFTGKDHVRLTHGTRLSFDFPRRQEFCQKWVVMHVGGNAENPRETSPVLPHNHYITPKNLALESSGAKEVSAFLLQTVGEELIPNVRVTKQCIAHIQWSDKTCTQEEFVWPKGAAGRARSVLSASRLPWVVKCEKIVPGQTIRNKAEYEASGVVSE